jgi:hypothetical protein
VDDRPSGKYPHQVNATERLAGPLRAPSAISEIGSDTPGPVAAGSLYREATVLIPDAGRVSEVSPRMKKKEAGSDPGLLHVFDAFDADAMRRGHSKGTW